MAYWCCWRCFPWACCSRPAAACESQATRLALQSENLIAARVHSSEAHTWAWFTLGYAGALVLFLLFVLFFIANNVAVGRTFFQLELIANSFGLILRAFWVNVVIFLAVARQAGPAHSLYRHLLYRCVFESAVHHCDLPDWFWPAPHGIGFFRNLPLEALAVLALTLTYGAYMAEVYRAGLESIHPSQWAASRSLGLSYGQTLRFVVVP